MRTAPIVCPEESPLVRPQAQAFCRWGLTRRLRRGSMAAVILWGSFAHLRGPKVSKGERREAGIRWIQPPKAVSDSEFRQTTSGAHGSANRADCLPRGKPFGAPSGAGLLPVGSDAPTMARVMGLPPRRGIVLSFDAKESTKESMRHGDSGKKAPIAHFDGGARNVARNGAG